MAAVTLTRRPMPPPGPQPGRPRATFSPGRSSSGKGARSPLAITLPPPPSPSTTPRAGILATSVTNTTGKPALPLQLSPDASFGVASKMPKWNRVKEAVETGSVFASLSVPFKTRRDEEER